MNDPLNVIMLFLFLIHSFTVSSQQVELPIHLADNLILLEGRINDQTGFLILDLGTSDLVLNKAHFTGQISNELSAYGLNGSQAGLKSSIVNLNLGALNWKNQRATLISLTHLEKAKNKKILGLIGGKLFRKSELIIDLSSMRVQIIKTKKISVTRIKEQQTSPPASVIPIKFKGGLPWMEVRINNTFFKFGLDTASESNIVSKKHLSFLEDIISKKRMLESRDVSGKRRRVLAAHLGGIEVGSLTCYPMKTLFADLSVINQNLVGPPLDGILGFDFFRQFKVALDFKHNEIRLWRYKSNFKTPLFLASELLSDTSSVLSEKEKRRNHPY